MSDQLEKEDEIMDFENQFEKVDELTDWDDDTDEQADVDFAEWHDQFFAIGSKFVDKNGEALLLHSVGESLLQLTYIASGSVYVQFVSVDRDKFCVNRDMSSNGGVRDLILKLSPAPNFDAKIKSSSRSALVERKAREMEREAEVVCNEIRLYLREIGTALAYNVKDPMVDGVKVDQTDVVEKFTVLVAGLMKTYTEVYNEMRDKDQFFKLAFNGFSHIQSQLYQIFTNSGYLDPDITAKFFFKSNGDVDLIISDEKEDVLRFEGHLQQNDTVLTTKAMKYIVIPNLKEVLNFQR